MSGADAGSPLDFDFVKSQSEIALEIIPVPHRETSKITGTVIMQLSIRPYGHGDADGMVKVWNEVVGEGNAFPQLEYLNASSGKAFFDSQSHCGVAEINWENGSRHIAGMYILHPNNVGRCAHIANASFAVAAKARGTGIGRKLVLDCLEQARKLGFKIMQFNAVVAGNVIARRLYDELGFTCLGTIPGGFYQNGDSYADICLYYRKL